MLSSRRQADAGAAGLTPAVVVGVGSGAVLKWEVIARAEMHPARLRILEKVPAPPPTGDPGWSASTLAETLNLPLATTSHHVRILRERGWLVERGRRQVRGAIQTFYGLSDAAVDR